MTQPEKITSPIDNPYEIIADERQVVALEGVRDYISQGREKTVASADGQPVYVTSSTWRRDGVTYQGSWNPTTGVTMMTKITNRAYDYEKLTFGPDAATGIMTVSWLASANLSLHHGGAVDGTDWNLGGPHDNLGWVSANGKQFTTVQKTAIASMINVVDVPAQVRLRAFDVAQAATHYRVNALLPEFAHPTQRQRIAQKVSNLLAGSKRMTNGL